MRCARGTRRMYTYRCWWTSLFLSLSGKVSRCSAAVELVSWWYSNEQGGDHEGVPTYCNCGLASSWVLHAWTILVAGPKRRVILITVPGNSYALRVLVGGEHFAKTPYLRETFSISINAGLRKLNKPSLSCVGLYSDNEKTVFVFVTSLHSKI